MNGELLIKNYELWFFRSAKILDKEFFNLTYCFYFKNIFLKKIYHDSIHHDISNEPLIIDN
jgi:hypothetical protein